MSALQQIQNRMHSLAGVAGPIDPLHLYEPSGFGNHVAVRNLHFWLHDYADELSGLVLWTDGVAYGDWVQNAMMITDRHAICAAHWMDCYINGQAAYWIGTDGKLYSRLADPKKSGALIGDVGVITFTQPLPPVVQPGWFLPKNWHQYFGQYDLVPGVRQLYGGTSAGAKYLDPVFEVGEIPIADLLGNMGSGQINWRKTTDPILRALHADDPVVSGTSGGKGFIPAGDHLCMATGWHAYGIDNSGGGPNYSAVLDSIQARVGPVQIADMTAAPLTATLQINDGEFQRSMIRKLVVRFNRPVGTLTSMDFRLTARDNGDWPWLIVADNGIEFTIQFLSTTTAAMALPDGIYDLTIPLTGQTFTFHALFGDFTGNKRVNNADLMYVRSTYLKSVGDPAYLWYADYDGSGVVNNADLLRVKNNYLKVLNY